MKAEDKLTKYQVEMLYLISQGNPEGEGPIDFDQMLDRLTWKPTKASCHFSVRALTRRQLLQKTPQMLRRGRMRVCFELTHQSRMALDPRLEAEPEKRHVEVRRQDSLPGVDEPELTLSQELFSLLDQVED